MALTSQPEASLTQLDAMLIQIDTAMECALANVPEQQANLIGALSAHQSGLILYQQAQIERLLKADSERQADMKQLQKEMKDVLDAAETFQRDSQVREEEVTRLRNQLS